jgi:hypothetical protein
MRDSAQSISVNIARALIAARGPARPLEIALGEAEETTQHLGSNLRARRIQAGEYWPLQHLLVVIVKMLNGASARLTLASLGSSAAAQTALDKERQRGHVVLSPFSAIWQPRCQAVALFGSRALRQSRSSAVALFGSRAVRQSRPIPPSMPLLATREPPATPEASPPRPHSP